MLGSDWPGVDGPDLRDGVVGTRGQSLASDSCPAPMMRDSNRPGVAGFPPARKLLPQVRKPNLHSDRGQDLNPCAWRPLGSQSAHGSTVPQRPIKFLPILGSTSGRHSSSGSSGWPSSRSCRKGGEAGYGGETQPHVPVRLTVVSGNGIKGEIGVGSWHRDRRQGVRGNGG
ncbi:hypothetical protein E2C01_086457 [Portunus trituberculatus]|uniref:Uncharacterized protein n=1 Tax=Portunus trituberculatus TaxID=210409 RepID=A0A5B7J0V1_PORTR|nr:hypothetical protein [Portunus trituberculatus]